MTATEIVEIIKALAPVIATIASVMAGFFALQASRQSTENGAKIQETKAKVQETHLLVNSRIEEFKLLLIQASEAATRATVEAAATVAAKVAADTLAQSNIQAASVERSRQTTSAAPVPVTIIPAEKPIAVEVVKSVETATKGTNP